jgi:SWI/SNF-related matrix-associated actin-dependent regulator of chromatin subfamily A member 5
LKESGFSKWGKRDFIGFVRGSERFGRTEYASITTESKLYYLVQLIYAFLVYGKSVEEVKLYAKVFWKRYKEINGYEKIIKQIQKGEERIKRNKEIDAILAKKVC